MYFPQDASAENLTVTAENLSTVAENLTTAAASSSIGANTLCQWYPSAAPTATATSSASQVSQLRAVLSLQRVQRPVQYTEYEYRLTSPQEYIVTGLEKYDHVSDARCGLGLLTPRQMCDMNTAVVAHKACLTSVSLLT